MTTKYQLGRHISISKGVYNGISTTYDYTKQDGTNMNAFQIFCKAPQRAGVSKISATEAQKVKEYIKKNKIYLCAHSGYIFNVSTDINTRTSRDKNGNNEYYGVNMVVDDIKTIGKCGGSGAIIHVGKHTKQTYEKGLENMIRFIFRTLELTAKEKACLILETSTGQGTEICVTIEQMADFYKDFKKYCKDKGRSELIKKLRFCIDTCHIFNAGYDISTKKGATDYIKQFDMGIGWDLVEVIHLNDSKNKCGAKLDRHENIGQGYLTTKGDSKPEGLITFLKHCKKTKKPIILETPAVKQGKSDEYKIIHEWLK